MPRAPFGSGETTDEAKTFFPRRFRFRYLTDSAPGRFDGASPKAVPCQKFCGMITSAGGGIRFFALSKRHVPPSRCLRNSSSTCSSDFAKAAHEHLLLWPSLYPTTFALQVISSREVFRKEERDPGDRPERSSSAGVSYQSRSGENPILCCLEPLSTKRNQQHRTLRRPSDETGYINFFPRGCLY